MRVKVYPSKLQGEVTIPPSKSLSHRALIAAALAVGTSRIKNVLFSKDIDATLSALSALGATFEKVGNDIIVTGTRVKRVSETIDCIESGSTIRFMIPLALLQEEAVTFFGEPSLARRPLTIYKSLFEPKGIFFDQPTELELPLTVKGVLPSGEYALRGDVSSQFITGLLYALPLLAGDSTIKLLSPLESKGYVDLTLDVLKTFGIEVTPLKDGYFIKGNQRYLAKDYTVEGDYSQAAFFITAGLLHGNITLKNMNPHSVQGDKGILSIVSAMEGNVRFLDHSIEVQKSQTVGSTIDLSQVPDLGPILTVLASFSSGETSIINAGRLRIKESDRIKAIVTELQKCGAQVTELDEGMHIIGENHYKEDVVCSSWNDHRICMALSIFASYAKNPIIIEQAECIKKSYPHFFEDFVSLGGKIDVGLE